MATEALTQDQLDQLHNWFSTTNTVNQQYAPTGITLDGMNFNFQGIQHQDEGGTYWTPSTGTVEASDPNDPNYAYSVDPQSGALSHYKIDKGDASFFGGVAKDLGNAAAPLAALYLAGTGLAAAGAGSAGGIGGSGFAAGTAGADAAVGTGAAVGGAGSDIFGGNGMYTGFTDSGTAGGSLDAAYAGGGTAGLGGAVTAADGTTALAPAATTAATTGATTAAGGSTIPAGATTAATTAAKVIAGSGGGTGGGGGGTNTGTGSGVTIGDIMKLIGGGVDYNNQNAAADKMLSYLQSRQTMNDNMYNPGSPEFNYLWNQMSRNDAAAGRNSQYGPRSVDLASRVAQLKMDANTKMTTGIANLMANAYNKQASAPAGLASTLANLTSGSGGSGGMTLDQLYKLLTSGGNASYGTNFDPSQFNDTNNPSNIGPTSADPSTYASDPNANNYSVDDQGLYF